MCTLTYVPVNHGFIFTHSRDESAQRPSSEKLQKAQGAEGNYFYPKDLKASGTWMALHEKQRAACLLNGGSQPYQPKDHYPVSRGNIIPACFQHTSVEEFYHRHDFGPYEPFTMLIREGTQLFQLIHNPGDTELKELNAREIQIWSSTKLYDAKTRQQRQDQFYSWLSQKPDLSAANLRDFHLRGENQQHSPGFRIRIPEVIETVSLTQIEVGARHNSIFYQRLPGMESDFLRL